MREERLMTAEPLVEEQALEASLRPRALDEFIGQADLKERLAIMLEAARTRDEVLGHILLSGPPGLGKTTLAAIIAKEMSSQLRATSGPALERPGDVAALLANLEPGDVFFIDEIHRLSRVVEEVLYAAMEDFQLDIVVGKGPTARSIRLDLPPFTLVGATTRLGMVTPPLRDRFIRVERLDFYELGDVRSIVGRAAEILGVEVTAEGAARLAESARGTPRIANRLLRLVRDYATARADGIVDQETTEAGLVVFEVDSLGLDKVDREILRAITGKFSGGPVGLSTLAIAVGEEQETVEDAYEPYLIQCGLLKRTPRGRVATPAAYAHLGVEVPAGQQQLLE